MPVLIQAQLAGMLAAALCGRLCVHLTGMPEISNRFSAHLTLWYLPVWTGHDPTQVQTSRDESHKSFKAKWSEAPYCDFFDHFGLL